MTQFTKASLNQFLEMSIQKGLVNTNTGGAWKAAVNKILGDLGDDQDVQGVDVHDAVIRYNNKFPGDLTPESLKKYEQRAGTAIEQFIRYKTDPLNYRSPSRGIKSANVGKSEVKPKKRMTTEAPKVQAPLVGRTPDFHPGGEVQGKQKDLGLQFPFPLRPDFVAQVHIPSSFTTEEAKRLSVFILALGHDMPANGIGSKS